MRIGFIILSRYNSTRLPGKALLEIDGKPLIQHIVDSLLVVTEKENIVVATSIKKTDKPIVDYCNSNNIQIYRGDLENVAKRFLDCANHYKFDFAVRINGDNLFIDKYCLRNLIEITKTNKYDFISNVKKRTFPKGMSFEIIRTEHYREKFAKFDNKDHFEHVTSYLYKNDANENYYYYYNTTYPEIAGFQLAIDTPTDLENAKNILKELKRRKVEITLKEISMLYKEVIHEEK